MLQQTQVATVLPYYDAFLARFPTVDALARARSEQVLARWAGLGYYRRARLLHAAARAVVREHEGRIPGDPDAFGRLPGIGRYTAGAVLSMAFDQPLPVLDGNVARVLARLHGRPLSIRDPAGARELWRLAESLVPMRRPGEWNQALMELGALVCVPRSPRCAECPVRSLCRAHATGRTAELPPVVRRRAPAVVRRAIVLLERDGRVLVARREGRLLGGLWEPPGVDVEPGRLRPALIRALADLGVGAGALRRTRHTLRRVLTHRVIEAEVWRGRMRDEGSIQAAAATRSRWIDPLRPRVPLTGLARDALALAE